MEPVDIRAALARIAGERGVSLAELSRILGRNPAYVQQYIDRGSPRRLSEPDRATLARYLGVPESVLGGPPERAWVAVPRIDAAASAGPGGWSSGICTTARCRSIRHCCASSACGPPTPR
ncbi:hypothetical protein [Sphingomonas hankookensis]|uniref:hypothetical protein n=1 Tax=Sphingomonas hankookensis TaxID=563996 RepID=UPI003D3020D5